MYKIIHISASVLGMFSTLKSYIKYGSVMFHVKCILSKQKVVSVITLLFQSG